MRVGTKIGFAGLFALLATVAYAQPKPALVQDRDEPGRNPFQLGFSSNACHEQIICIVDAPGPVSAGRRLVVTQVSIGTSTTGAGGEQIIATLTNNAGADDASFLVSGPGNARFGTFPIQRYYEAGTTPRLLFSIGNGEMSGNMRVTLVGYYILLP